MERYCIANTPALLNALASPDTSKLL